MTRDLAKPVPTTTDDAARWRIRSFWASVTAASLGSTLSTITVPFLLTLTLGLSPIEVSTVMVAPLIANLLSPLYAGVLADTLDRRRTMVTTDIVQAAILIALGFAGAFAGDSLIPVLIVLNFLFSAAGAVSSACFRAGFPDIVGDKDLVKANSRLQTVGTTTDTAGGLVGGGALVAIGAPLVFTINGIIKLFSALTILPVRWPGSSPRTRGEEHTQHRPYWKRIGAGFSFVIRDRLLFHLVLASTLGSIFISASGLALLWLLVRDNEMSYFGYTVILTIGSAGAILGAIAAEKMGDRVRPEWLVQGIMLSGYGIFLGCYGFITGTGWITVAVCSVIDFSIGFVLSIYIINNSVQQQRIVPSSERGGVSAVRSFGNGVAGASGTWLAGIAIDHLGSHTTMFVCGAAVLLIGIWFLLSMSRL